MLSSKLSHAQLTLMRSGTHSNAPLSETSFFILHHGWAPATTRQYSAAVNKFLVFLESENNPEQDLPSSAPTIYKFIFWCSMDSTKRVTTNTIKRYLTGLRMWHTLHELRFPLVDLHRVRLLLKACKKTEGHNKTPLRVGLGLDDVLQLCDRLSTSSVTDLVMRAIILVGFWGLARLGELTLNRDHPDVFIRRKDLSFSPNGRTATIRIRLAKTALHGEIQHLRLSIQPNRLDPIKVLNEVLERCPGRPDDLLFPGTAPNIPMARSCVSNLLKRSGPEDAGCWSGHSLRIGGASFQHHAGRSIASLKRLGRWRSSAYKSYVHKYSDDMKGRATRLARLIHF